ncbi:MAG: hypothetical protein KBT68_06600 [bacterium]|nr:hypothetical protein [Candidatus Colisoma equi]
MPSRRKKETPTIRIRGIGIGRSGGINNVHAGDVLKMSVEIDPSKSSEYEAGTMELTATVG